MARRVVVVDSRRVVVADDDALPADLGWWAVLRTRAVDELTGQPPPVPLRVLTRTPRCMPRVGTDGLCGLVARPRDASTALVTPGRLTATIEADGYLPHALDAAIDAARRALPGGAAAGATVLTVAPPDAVPREQFLPGRGVMLARTAGAAPEQFTRHADPAVAPAPNQVPLVDAVQPARPANARVAGVPVVLPAQALHRAEPARIRGRARRQVAAGTAPVDAPGAQIGLRGVWWTYREVAAHSAPPHPPDFVSMVAPLAFAHAAGAPVQRCTLAPDGVARELRALAAPRAIHIAVHPWNALNPAGGDVLQVEAAPSAERELVVTDGFGANIDPAMPALVRLRTPLAHAHAPRAPVARVAVAAAPLGALDRAAVAGDRMAFLTTVAGLATDDVLRIAPGTPQAELRFVRSWPTWDGLVFTHPVPLAADGSFELPPLARVAQVQLQVAHAGHPPHLPVDYAPDYGGENRLSILFTP